MIKSNTVLVLGAGASAPFGFPIGKGLKDEVCGILFKPEQRHILESLGFEKEKTVSFGTALTNSGRQSIDAFLENREDFLDIGNAAIATTLLPYETTPSLFKDWILKRKKTELPQEGNWYDHLYGILSDGTSFDEFDSNKLKIITFNYDRSLEHYLFTSLKNSYNKTDDECGEKLRKIDILHVHGSLGLLDWQSRPTDLSSVPYDSGINPEVVKLAAENIKVINENVVDTPEFLKARKLILRAQRLFFLGFGYHPMNLRRLGMEYMEKKQPVIVQGTCLGLSKERDDKVKHLYLFLREISLIEKDVYTFLYNFVILSPA